MIPHLQKQPRLLDTVRSRLTLVLVLAMLPVLAFSIANAVRDYADRKLAAERDLVRGAELVTHEVGTVFSSAEQVMLVARSQSMVVRGESPACQEFLAGALAGREIFSNIATISAAGDVVCSARPSPGPHNVADKPWFQRFQRGKAFSVGGPATGPVSGEAVLTVTLPMNDEAAASPAPTALIITFVKASLLDRFMRVTPAPADTDLFLLNADGELLLANGPLEALPAESAISGVIDPERSFIAAPSRSEQPYLYAAISLHEGEIIGLLARPAIRADAPILIELAMDVAIPVILTAITLLIVWLATDRVSLRWIRKLRAVALAHGRGSSDVRAREIEVAPLEYRELGEALNSMAEAIEQRQSRLLSALAGRELLLREIHHRVKNNLQIIISLFNLLARNAEDEATKLLIRDMLARVESLALVHHAAYQSDDVQLISMRSFVPNLLTHLSHTLDDRSAEILIESEVDDIFLTMDETIPLAQLMTEAVSNSLKHAFVGRASGRIMLRLLRIAPRKITLEISDDGVGLPADFETRPARRQLGQSLMSAFARQLGGMVTLRSQNGTTISADLSFVEGERSASPPPGAPSSAGLESINEGREPP